MSLQTHLLACLAEEATEVSQEAVNCIREGSCAVPTFESDVTYREALSLEYADMHAIMEIMRAEGYPIPVYGDWFQTAVEFQKNKFAHQLEGQSEEDCLLTLIKELNIMGQTVSKCIRFTMDHYHPAYGKTNKEQVAESFAAVVSVVNHIDRNFFKIPVSGADIEIRIQEKKKRTIGLYKAVTMTLMGSVA